MAGKLYGDPNIVAGNDTPDGCAPATAGVPGAPPDKPSTSSAPAGASPAAVPSRLAGGLSHVDDLGKARMVDVSAKPHTDRHAVARCVVEATEKAESLLDSAEFSKERMKGIVDAVGRMGAARTPYLIPLCHQILLDRVDMQLDLGGRRLQVLATVEAHDRTGVEMEALTAVTLSGLALVTELEAQARIMEVSLLLKDGGRSGTWRTQAPHVTLLLFAGAREAAGTGRLVLRAYDVADVLAQAHARFGADFREMERVSACWVNSWQATAATALIEGDEVALLPPVSGG
ncbi:MAG: MoaD/ThiS family protein [Actinobacteria bacterium]|nr:MoaD/ThiS family protein [Actinomycetota bacterium]MCL5446632.1 MoaD/ThiS family protein [Actinomycetota bacterium]